MTAKEVVDVMRQLQRAADARLQEALLTAKGARRRRLLRLFKGETSWVWSLDNPPIHTCNDYSELGISTDDWAPLPPASGDMHRVIEHVHGTLTREMQRWLLCNRGQSDMATLQAALTDLFFRHITQEGVDSDVGKLPALWDAVVEAQGSYVSWRLRWGGGVGGHVKWCMCCWPGLACPMGLPHIALFQTDCCPPLLHPCPAASELSQAGASACQPSCPARTARHQVAARPAHNTQSPCTCFVHSSASCNALVDRGVHSEVCRGGRAENSSVGMVVLAAHGGWGGTIGVARHNTMPRCLMDPGSSECMHNQPGLPPVVQ